jgi:hypothetical protein
VLWLAEGNGAAGLSNPEGLISNPKNQKEKQELLASNFWSRPFTYFWLYGFQLFPHRQVVGYGEWRDGPLNPE